MTHTLESTDGKRGYPRQNTRKNGEKEKRSWREWEKGREGSKVANQTLLSCWKDAFLKLMRQRLIFTHLLLMRGPFGSP